MVCYSHLFQNFPHFGVVHTVKGFGIVNKAEIDVFLELSCFFNDPMDVGSLSSGTSAFSKTSLNIWKFKVHVLLKPSLENFKHYFASVWDECNCAVVWAFFGTAFLWDQNENWSFPVLWPRLSLINNYLKFKWIECPNQKTKTGWMNTKTRPLYMLSTKDPPQNKGHIQTKSEGLEKDTSQK